MHPRFHIHLDATVLSSKAAEELRTHFGMYRNDFCGHPVGLPHFEPTHHLTVMPANGAAFRDAFRALRTCVERNPETIGYLEGEYIPDDLSIVERAFDANVVPPPSFHLTNLPPGVFRETEVHVTMDRDRSDPRVAEALLGLGMFGAYLPKPYGTAIVLTTQGSRGPIRRLFDRLREYLNNVGGVVSGSLKEERIIDWWATSPEVTFPPVILEEA